ncbi:hypothetical protein ACFLZK_00765 [Patescibacteria group bacterium]
MTQVLNNLEFSKKPISFMHIDLNSCFATVEQQANPLLRNIPVAVAAYNSPRGVILAPSIEAKKLGITVGFRVSDAKKICPDIKILEPDTKKYRFVHHALKNLLLEYTDEVNPKSVDEFILNFKNAPKYNAGLINVGQEIKDRIKNEVGDYITVSIGVSKNRFLAKTASNLKKPDGLEIIDEYNYKDVYSSLELMDLTGIAKKTLIRLNNHGIHTVWDLYNASAHELKTTFQSVVGNYWYLRLRGYEIENYKDVRRSFGHQYSLPKPLKTLPELTPILTKLVEKMGFRLRNSGYKTQGIHLSMLYSDYTRWHMGKKTKRALYDSRDIYKEVIKLFFLSPQKEVRVLGVSCFNLTKSDIVQLELFTDVDKSQNLTKLLDDINNRWGKFVISPASMLGTDNHVHDRIGFGNV